MSRGARTAMVAAVAAAVALSGCGVDKADEQAHQLDVIGDVQVSTTFCTGGDTDADAHGCAAFTRDRRGQALVAYRLPEGSHAPDTLAEDAGKLQFALSDSYSAYMEATYPEPGMQWAGYVSEPHSFDAGYRNAFTVSPRFPLPGAGTPFVGPFRYQVVGGYRVLAGPEEDGSAPVDCAATGGLTDCVSSGAPGADSAQPVRDLAVTPAPGRPEVAPGGHVRVPFRMLFAGPAAGGAAFDLAASTDLAGARVELPAGPLEPAADSDTPIAADVTVPAGAAPGVYRVDMTAAGPGEEGTVIRKVVAGASGAGEERSGTATFRVVAPGSASADGPATAAPGATPGPAIAPASEQPVNAAPARAHLELSLSATPRRAYGGGYASYLLVARNASRQAAIGTRVCEALPRRVQFVDSTARARFRGGRICFDRGRLGAGRSLVALVYVHVDTDARSGLARARATATARNADRARARASLRVLRRAAAARRAPVTG